MTYIVTRTLTVTDRQIRALRNEAADAGDEDMAALCEDALSGHEDSIAEVARVIRDAAAMDSGGW